MSLWIRLVRALGFVGLLGAAIAAIVAAGQPFDLDPELAGWLDPGVIGFLGLAAALVIVMTRPRVATDDTDAEPAPTPATAPKAPPAAEAPASPRVDGPPYTLHFNHEARTPITAILGYAEMLSAADASAAERVEFLKATQRNCQILARLVDETLAFARTESGEIAIQRETTNLVELLNEPVLLVGADAAAKRLAIRVQAVGSVPEHVSTDALYVRQILVQLLQTAIKLSDAGEILVSFRFAPADGDAPGTLSVEVQDTAVSLTPEIRRALFDPSSEATLQRVDLLGGAGLRLAIARRLAERLEGTLDPGPATATHGCFHLVLPTGAARDTAWIEGTDLSKRAQPRRTNAKTVPLAGRVLVVESAPEIGWLLRALVARRGVEVESCSGSLEAFDRLLNPGDGTDPWAAVIVDVDDPDVDGTLLVRRLLLDGVDIPIVAVGNNDAVPAESASRVAVVTKPARGLALYDVVRPHLRPAA